MTNRSHAGTGEGQRIRRRQAPTTLASWMVQTTDDTSVHALSARRQRARITASGYLPAKERHGLLSTEQVLPAAR